MLAKTVISDTGWQLQVLLLEKPACVFWSQVQCLSRCCPFFPPLWCWNMHGIYISVSEEALPSPKASLSGPAKAFRVTWSKRKCVSCPFAPDTSPKWIDREGLGKRRTGTSSMPIYGGTSKSDNERNVSWKDTNRQVESLCLAGLLSMADILTGSRT